MATSNQPPNTPGQRDTLAPEKTAAIALDAVADAVARLRFGAIALTIHDGRVVQLDVTERHRFT